MTKYGQSCLLQNCCMWERVKGDDCKDIISGKLLNVQSDDKSISITDTCNDKFTFSAFNTSKIKQFEDRNKNSVGTEKLHIKNRYCSIPLNVFEVCMLQKHQKISLSSVDLPITQT